MSGENPKVVKPVSKQEQEPKFDKLLDQIAKPAPEAEVKNPVEPVPVTNEVRPIEVKPTASKVEKTEEPPQTKPTEAVETKPTSEPIKKEEPVIMERPEVPVSHLAEDQAKRLEEQLKQAQREPDDQKVIENIEQEIFGYK